MTPNPQNIGAAPEEYPIRALVRSEDYGGRFNGKEIWVRKGKFPRANGCPSTYGGFDYDDLFYSEKDEWINKDYVWRPDELEILSAPQEGEALPTPKAEGNPPYQVEEMDLGPDPLAKGPSLPEVPQPGEGVDLEALASRLEKLRRAHLEVEDGFYSCAKHEGYFGHDDRTVCTCGADESNAELDAILADLRATLRRESK